MADQVGTQVSNAQSGGSCPFDHHAIRDAEDAWATYERLREAGVVRSGEHGGY